MSWWRAWLQPLRGCAGSRSTPWTGAVGAGPHETDRCIVSESIVECREGSFPRRLICFPLRPFREGPSGGPNVFTNRSHCRDRRVHPYLVRNRGGSSCPSKPRTIPQSKENRPCPEARTPSWGRTVPSRPAVRRSCRLTRYLYLVSGRWYSGSTARGSAEPPGARRRCIGTDNPA
jgi:hypothetical protein